MELEEIIQLAVEDTNRPDLVEHFRKIADSVVRAAHGVEVFEEDLHIWSHTVNAPPIGGIVQLLEWALVGMRGLYKIECFDQYSEDSCPSATDFPKLESLEGYKDYWGFQHKRGYMRSKGQLLIQGVPENTTRIKIYGSKFPNTQVSVQDGVSMTTDSWIARDYPEILQHGFAIRGHYISGKSDSLGVARQMYAELLNQMISTKAGEIYGR